MLISEDQIRPDHNTIATRNVEDQAEPEQCVQMQIKLLTQKSHGRVWRVEEEGFKSGKIQKDTKCSGKRKKFVRMKFKNLGLDVRRKEEGSPDTFDAYLLGQLSG